MSRDAYAGQSTPFLRVPPPQGDPRIPTTVRNFCRSSELEERGLCPPQLSRGFWPLSLAELYATHLTASSTPMPATIVALILPFLLARNHVSLQQTHSSFHVLWRNSCLFHPAPGTYCCCCFGFGKSSPPLSTSHSGRPSPYLLVHLAWSWITIPNRQTAAEALPLLRHYAQLCRAAVHLDLSSLQAARPATDTTPICKDHAYRTAAVLLRTGFHYVNFVCWLGGEYTGVQRDWHLTFDIVKSVRMATIPPDYPEIDFDRAVWIATEGVPLAGHFENSFASVQTRERHDNASLTLDVLGEVRKKFTRRNNCCTTLCFLVFSGRLSPASSWLSSPGPAQGSSR